MARVASVITVINQTLKHIEGVLSGKVQQGRSFDLEHAQMVVCSMRTMLDAAYLAGSIDWDTYEKEDTRLEEYSYGLESKMEG